MHERVQPHAPQAKRETVLEPVAHLPCDGCMVSEVEHGNRLVAKQEQRGVEILPYLGHEEAEHMLVGVCGRSANHRFVVER